jgi:nitrogen fixation/metabolism regulation signal transduction histidine kinase
MSLDAEKIEKSVSQGDQDGAEVLIAELARPFNAMISDLSAWKAAMEGGLDTQANAGEQTDRAKIEAILHQLTSAIEAFDPSAQDIAEQLVGLMGPSHPQATELLRLTEQYEFDAALTMVHQLHAQNASG